MVVISCIACLLVIKELGSVGVGTVVAAVLVGTEVKLLGRFFGDARDKRLGIGEAVEEQPNEKPLYKIMKRDVYVIRNDDSILDALKLMKAKNVSGFPVVDHSGEIVGFISDGDIIRHLSAEHSIFVDSHSLAKIEFNTALKSLMLKDVSSLATKKVITVNAEDDLDEVCYVLGENHLKKAPVMQNGKMIGIINVSNIIKYAVDLMDESA